MQVNETVKTLLDKALELRKEIKQMASMVRTAKVSHSI